MPVAAADDNKPNDCMCLLDDQLYGDRLAE